MVKWCARRVVAVVAASGLVLTACGDGGDEQASSTTDDGADENGTGDDDAQAELEVVQVMAYPGQSYRIPMLVAQQEGIFADRGITIEVVDQPGNITGTQGLVATESQVGYVAVPTLAQGWQAGEEVAFFCGGIQVTETSLFALPDSQLPAIDDGASADDVLAALNGATVGVQTPIGSGLQLYFEAAMGNVGITDLEFVNTGVELPIVLASLEAGDVTVVQANPVSTQVFEHTGDAKELIYLPDHLDAYRLYGSAIVGDAQWLEEQPDLAAAYCEGIDEALAFIGDAANAEVVEQIMVDDLGIEPDVATLVRERSFPEYSTEIPEDVFNDTIDFYTELGVIQPDPKPTYEDLVVAPAS